MKARSALASPASIPCFLGPWVGANFGGGFIVGLLCQSLPSLLVGLMNGFGWAVYGLSTGIWLVRQRAGI